MILTNSNGLTMLESINRDLKNLSLWFSNDDASRASLTEIRGKINCAFEFGQITENQWETFLEKVFLLNNL